MATSSTCYVSLAHQNIATFRIRVGRACDHVLATLANIDARTDIGIRKCWRGEQRCGSKTNDPNIRQSAPHGHPG